MKKRSGFTVMARLIGLVKPLSGYMVLAILMGLVGNLCAAFITIFGGFAVLDLLGFATPVALKTTFVCVLLFALVRGIFRYAEQSCNHFIAFKLLALIRDKVFRALRRLCPAKLEGRDRGDLISVITSDDIRRSSARTVGELLEDIPGVQIMNDGTQGLKRLSIRGEDAFRTLVMIDGQKISEHKSMSGAPILIDPTEIERIEVIKGPASVLYGSDAIGGAREIHNKVQ